MKQVYATGATIHAMSPGVVAESIIPLASHQSQLIDQAHRPVRLSLINTPATGRVLSHFAPHGESYFSHLLIDVPQTTDAQTAIQTWGSPQWQRRTSETKSELPELPFLPVADLLDDSTLRVWLIEPSHQRLLEYALSAYLIAGLNSQIYLNASSDDMAMIVFAVTRSLPGNLTDQLTFSTYEPEPLKCSAKLIGCETEWDLPDACYENGNYGFNPAKDRKTLLIVEVGFAEFAVKALASGDFAKLDDYRQTWQRLGLSDKSQFDLFDRLYRQSGSIHKGEINSLLQSPAVAMWLAGKPETISSLTEWALDDQSFATQAFSRIVQTLRSKTDSLQSLSESIRTAGFDAVKSGNVTRASNAFDIILPMVAPAKAQAVWSDVQTLNPRELSWDARWALLPKIVRNRLQQAPATSPTDVAAWLDVPSEQLGQFLTLDLPKPFLVHAAKASRTDEEMPIVAKAIGQHPHLAMAALQPRDDGDAKRSGQLFAGLLEETPTQNWFEETLKANADYPSDLLNQFFETELAKGRTDVDRLIRTQSETLLRLFEGRSGLETLSNRFLANPPGDLVHQSSLVDFLNKVKENASAELASKIDAVTKVHTFHQQPQVEADGLSALAKSLDLTPSPLPATAKAETFRVVANHLKSQFDSPDFQNSYETVVASLGSTLAKGPADLFQDLLRELRGSEKFATNINAVSSALAIALGATKTPGLTLEGLESEAMTVASMAAKVGNQRFLDEIDRKTGDWPREALAKWGFLKEAVRPPATRWGRDVLCFTLGVGAMAITWAIWWAVNHAK